MTFLTIRRAFSLVEVLVVLAILAVAAIIIVPNLLGGSHQADLTGTTQQIIASLRDVQSKSAQQVQDAQWGIHFSNATNTAPYYAVFSGSSYVSGTVQGVYRLPPTVGFVSSTLPVGSSLDVTFSPVSGSAVLSTNIQIYSISQPSDSSTISILASGEVMTGAAVSDLYVGDANNNRVEKFDSSGNFLSQLGCTSGACEINSGNGQFGEIAGVAAEPNGIIYVVDGGNNRVEKFNVNDAYLSQLGCTSGACTTGSGNGQFGGFDMVCGLGSTNGIFGITTAEAAGGGGCGGSIDEGIAVDLSGNVYVSDSGNNRVEKFDASGNFLSQLGCTSGACTTGSGNGQFGSVDSIAVDPNGNIYVIDQANNRVEKFNSSGTYLSQLGCASGTCSYGSGNGQFNGPGSIAVDASGNVYVVDFNNRVEKFNSSGTYLSQLGCASGACTAGSGNGQFNIPTGVAIDLGGNIYVADQNNNRVEKFNSSGTYLSQLGCASGACTTGSGGGQFKGLGYIAAP